MNRREKHWLVHIVTTGSMVVACTAEIPETTPAAVEPAATESADAVSAPAKPRPMGGEDGLLAAHQDGPIPTTGELKRWRLPERAGALVAALLAAASRDEPDALARLLAEHARWGLPDRRQLRARPIFTGRKTEFRAFVRAFTRAAARFEQDAVLGCPPVPRPVRPLIRTGAEPHWCAYRSTGGLDLLVFRMRDLEGRPQIEYVGFYEQRPLSAIRVPGGPPPPPMLPALRDTDGGADGPETAP